MKHHEQLKLPKTSAMLYNRVTKLKKKKGFRTATGEEAVLHPQTEGVER